MSHSDLDIDHQNAERQSTMIQVTVRCYESKWTTRAMQRLKPPTIIDSAILETEPDYSVLGEPSVDWLILSPTHKQRQFVKRDHAKRLDYLFIVDAKEQV